MPLFVLQIADNGPASIDNRLRVSRIVCRKENIECILVLLRNGSIGSVAK